MGPSLLNLEAAEKGSALLGAAKLLRLFASEFPRASPDGSWALHRLDTLSDRFIIALCTKPPSPLVGDDDLERSGDSRLGDIGDDCSSEVCSGFRGSSFCALERGIGEPRPVAVDTEETLEYRLLTLLSAKTELARDGERDRDSGTSCWMVSFSGSALFSTSGAGSLLPPPPPLSSGVVSGTFSSAGLFRVGEPRLRSVRLSGGGGSFADVDNALGLRGAAWSSFEVVDMARQRFSRVGELDRNDLLPPRSREDGRCCQDKVPVLLRRGDVEVEGGFGEVSISLPSTLDPLRLPSVVIDTSSRIKSDFGVDSRSGS